LAHATSDFIWRSTHTLESKTPAHPHILLAVFASHQAHSKTVTLLSRSVTAGHAATSSQSNPPGCTSLVTLTIGLPHWIIGCLAAFDIGGLWLCPLDIVFPVQRDHFLFFILAINNKHKYKFMSTYTIYSHTYLILTILL